MGSPVSGLFAEFKLRSFEKFIFDTFDNQQLQQKQHFGCSNTDDIFILWKHGHLVLDDFLCNVINLDNNTKFTLEIEKNDSLPFLDVHLRRNGQKLSSTVYRNLRKKILLSSSMISCLFNTELQRLNPFEYVLTCNSSKSLIL